jgi:trans-2,3-dihydro-3-hydroxyanthranilate isomerase
MNTYRYNTLKVFTDGEAGGNPLAVFVQASGLSDAAMQEIAADLNLSETVFVFPALQGGRAKLRIFTPTNEVSFAGHPTVGTAWLLGTHLVIPRMRLETAAGMVEAELERSGDLLYRARVRGPRAERIEASIEGLPEAIGVKASVRLPPKAYRCGLDHCLVDVGSREVLANLQLDVARLSRLVGGVYAFALGDVISVRYFAPGLGVLEDAATGSAALALGQYLLDEGVWDGNKALDISQTTAAGRSSSLEVSSRRTEDGRHDVFVGGSAVVTGRGERTTRGLGSVHGRPEL